MAIIKTSDDSKKMSHWDNLFKDTDYWDSYQSIINAYDEPTPQTLWGALTGKNETNAYNHQMARNNAIDALAQKMRDEQYQSYENQVQQQRKAGLNPDLNGVQAGQVGQSSSNGVPDVSAESPLRVANDIFSAVMSAYNLATQYQNTLSSSFDLDSQRIDNQMKMDLFAGNYILGNIVPASFTTDGKLREDAVIGLIQNAGKYGRKFNNFSRRQLRSFQDSVTRMINNPESTKRFYDILSGSESSRRSYLMQTSGSFYNESDAVMRDMLGPLVNTMYNLTKVQKSNRLSDENLYKAYKSSGRDIVDNLHKSYNKGNTMAGVALFLLNHFDIFKDLAVGFAKSYVESE